MTQENKAGGSMPEKLTLGQNLVLCLHDVIYYLAAICIVLLVVFRIVIVSGTSMNGTLLDGDYLLLLSNVFYTEPQQGDIVVLSKESFDDGKPIVKRVIATEGQIVDFDFENGIVYVDGLPLEEDYILEKTTVAGDFQYPILVQEGCVFVMGDNRNNSRDSRFLDIGMVDKREILGKAIILFVPGTNYGEYEPDYSRIGVID